MQRSSFSYRMVDFIRKLAVVFCLLVCLGHYNPGLAQSGEGMGGWVSPAGPSGVFASAEEACQAQWSIYRASQSRYIGAFPNPDNWRQAGCSWTTFQYLCPQETGYGIGGCGTILPVYVEFHCASGYSPTVDGHCRKNEELLNERAPCVCDNGGHPNPIVGNPIILSSGAKIITASDYETNDGLLRIGRHYRSFQVGRPIDGVLLPRSLPRGLIGGWNFDFNYEIQLGNFSGSPSSPTAKVAILAPDGTGYGFVLQSNGQWVADPSTGTANISTEYKLEYVGTLPSNLADIKSSPSDWRLTHADDNVWTLKTRIGPNGGSYIYGWPTSRTARGGYTWTYAYNTDSSLASITDSFGRAINFSWNNFYITALPSQPEGRRPYPLAISSIALPDGTSIRYTYDPPAATSAPSSSMIQRLIKVERLNASSAIIDSTSYLYEDVRWRGHVTGIIDNLNNRVATYAYDARGHAVLTEGANGSDRFAVDFTQTGTTLTRSVTTPLGKVSTYRFSKFSTSDADLRLTQIDHDASPNSPAASLTLSYGTDTFLSGQTDEESRLTTFVRDTKGRATSTTEASGTSSARTIGTSWNASYNLPATLTRPGVTEARTYSAAGLVTSVTLTDTTSHTVPYSTNGQSRTYTYGWNAADQLLSVNGPLAPDAQGRDDITSFVYDAVGNLQTLTNPLGQVTTYAGYDGNGRPGTMTDINGIVTAFTYDTMGRIATLRVKHPTTAAQDALTTFAYDAAGRMTSLTLPSTETLLMDYDGAGRVTSVRAANGERRDYSYDSLSNVTSEVVKRSDATNSLKITRGFDEFGRMISEVAGPWRMSRWGYDKVGNVTQSVTPNGNATVQAFDALDRVVSVLAPDNGTTTQTYDAQDNVTSFTDARSVATQFVRNGFGEVIRETSPDRGSNTYWYDNAGALIKSSDGRGQIIDFTRDYASRITNKVPQGRPASETITYVWDTGGLSGSYNVGRIGQIVDGAGTTQLKYDHRGNLLAREQTIGTGTAQVAYAYDLADRVTQITYPSGRLVRYSYDSKGRVSVVDHKASAADTSWSVLANGFTYEPFGPVKGMEFGNGLTVANDWGDDRRLVSRRLYRTSDNINMSWLSYGYDNNDNITAITNGMSTAGPTVYGYDALDRLILTSTPNAGTAGTTNLTYANGTNRLTSVSNSLGTRTISYDGRGNTASEARPGSVSVSTTYDGYGRLTGYTRTGNGVLTFAYNGLDDRVMMTSGAGTRRFVYDPDGRVLGEYGASASDVKAEFIWARPTVANDNAPFGGDDGVSGYSPLAVATLNGSGTIQMNWVHGNHLGVPLVITDSTGGIAGTPDDYLAPGFPGQSKVLPDLYYNRYRDFDPSTGRYIQADPIGLEGGQNVYVYAENNPIRFIDPLGLQAGVVPLPVCFAGPWGLAACGAGGAAAACFAIPACRNAIVPPPTSIPAPPPSESRSKSDPVTLPPVNPGKDCDGKCNPCPKGARWWVSRPGHGHKNGYWHTIVYNQDPKTCMCYPDRPSRGLQGK